MGDQPKGVAEQWLAYYPDLDEVQREFLEKALEVYEEQSGGDDQLMAGNIARSLKWRITGPELNKFVRRLHSRGFVLRTDFKTLFYFVESGYGKTDTHR